MTERQIRRTLRRAEKLFGLPRGWLRKIAMIESRMNPHAVNPSTKAAGLFQFLELTAKEENLVPFDVIESAAITAKRIRRLLGKLNQETLPIPTLTYVYLTHQQGERGAREICACIRGAIPELSDSRLRNMRANLPGSAGKEFDQVVTHAAKCRIFVDFWKKRIA